MGQIVPAIDLRSPDGQAAALPSNTEAEQALLGALMFDNGAYERLDEYLRPAHFYEPFHQRLYAAIVGMIRKGQLAEPILLDKPFEQDPAYQEMGGIIYLADLVDRAPPAANAPQYARNVYEMALRRDLIRIGTEIAINAAEPAPEHEAQEQIEVAEAELFKLAENRSGSGVVTFSDAVTGAIQMAAEAHSREGGIAGLSTGLIDLDQKIGGMHPSDLIILAARPSMGKTAMAVNIGHYVAKNYAYDPQPDGSRKTARGGVVLVFSLEMSAEQLALRAVCAEAEVSGDRVRKGEIDAVEFGRLRDSAMHLQDMPLFIDATGGLALPKLFARARRQKRLTGLDLIIVDYLQLVTTGGKAENRVQEVSAITQGLKALAKELNVPVLALSQLSRQVESREDKKPQLSDLRDSGSIEQDADMVIFLYREAYYLSRLEPREGTEEHLKWAEQMEQAHGLAEAIVGKQRHGPIGTVRLSFNEDLTKFGNVVRDSSRYYADARNPAGAD